MPANYSAQGKMTAKIKAAAGARHEVVKLAPTTLLSDSGAKRNPVSSLRQPGKSDDHAVVAELRIANLPSVRNATRLPLGYSVAKRIFDLTFGVLLLLLAIPFILVAALAIRLDTPGSPFFFQTRIGKNGKPFRIFKLRGMHMDARKRFAAYYDYSGKRDLEFCFHHEDDPRVTRAGKFIRKTSVDELPNLWNVVLGDMSLVGPRPEIPDVLALYGSYRDQYLSVKPGITCLSKCTGRDRLTKRETIEFDLQYVQKCSFSVDLKILWRTFLGVLLRRDVF